MPKYGDYSDGAPAAGTDIVLVKRPSGPSTLRLTLANVLTYISANLNALLVAIAGLGSNGLIARTGSGTAAARTITAPAAGLTVSNGDGVSGNPTFALANDLAALEALAGTNTIYYRSAADTWSSVTISTGLNFAGGTLTCTVSGGASAFTGLSDAPANYTSAGNKLVQVNSGATGLQFTTVASVLDTALGSTQGAVAYRNASGWTALSPGSFGQVLQTNGPAADPTWATPVGGSVAAAYGYTYTAPAFASVSALLHFDGTNGSTTITDQVGNTWTAAGTAAISTAQSVFGGAALLVPGSGNSGVSMTTNSGFNVGASEWTIEFRWKYNGAPQSFARIFSTRNGDVVSGITILVDASGIVTLSASSNGGTNDIANGTIMTLSQSSWNSVLIQRKNFYSADGGVAVSSMIEAFLDGVLKASFPVSSGSIYYNAADSVIIGGNVSSTSRSMNAYIDEFRFTKGVALATLRYPNVTSAFPNS